MTKTISIDRFSKKIRKYLKEKRYPYLQIEGTNNLLVLKSEGEYHYLAIQFSDFPDRWFQKRRHFKFKIVYGNDYEQLVNSIEQYFNQECQSLT